MSGPSSARARIRAAALAAVLLAAAGSAGAAEGDDPASWLFLGGFRGSASSSLAEEARDLVFGFEQDGDLYQDLGNVTLGLGYSQDDFNLKWDNSFFRQVEPLHEQLPLESTLTSGDLSSFVDVQGAISRFRLRYGIPQDITGDFGLGAVGDRGWSLTLSRVRQPLIFGDRPLEEVLAERDIDHLRDVIELPPLGQRDIVDLSAEAVAGIARWIAQGVRSTADTERGTIFYQGAADPITLFSDVGIPIPAEMFTAADPRLSVGDRVRHITFFAVSPIAGGIGEFGLNFGYEVYTRFLRETTIAKEPDNQVLVSVRHVKLLGNELQLLKIRPELRLLSIITLGYTFFEKRYSRGGTASSGLVYRIDLDQPEGYAALADFLAETKNVRSRPLQVAAERGQGAELLADERRRGKRRTSHLRISLFSPFRFNDDRTTYSDRVKVGDFEFDELGMARLRRFRKKLGRNREWTKQYLLSSQGNLHLPGTGADETSAEGTFAVNLLTGYASRREDGADIRRRARLLATGLGPHPVLDRLLEMEDDERSDFFVSLRVSFGPDHMLDFLETAEDEIWDELAEIMLGPAHTDTWATPGARRLWKRRRHRRAFEERLAGERDSLPQPGAKRLTIKGRFKLAKRAAKGFARAQELIRDESCLDCLSAAFKDEAQIVLMQTLLYRLAADPETPEPGHQYEIFAEPLISPVTVGNNVTYDFAAATRAFEEATDEPAPTYETEIEATLRRISLSQSMLGGAKNLVTPSDARLRAGDLYLDVSPDDPHVVSRLRLRLYSDYRFSPDLMLRVDLRQSKVVAGDPSQETVLVALGEPGGVIDTPFATARFYYDLPLTPTSELLQDQGYTMLLRVLNPEGRPVTEEQLLRFRWPETAEVSAVKNPK